MTPDVGSFVVQAAGLTNPLSSTIHRHTVPSPINASPGLLYVPSYVALASVAILLLHAIFHLIQKFFRKHKTSSTDELNHVPQTHSKSFLESHGGRTIATFRALRAIGCVTLFAFWIAIVVVNYKTESLVQHTRRASLFLCITFVSLSSSCVTKMSTHME
jgi:hypothetical protein